MPAEKRGRIAGHRAQPGQANHQIHAVADRLGRLIEFELTPGQRSDIGVANSLLATLPKVEQVLGETAYDGDGLRALLAERGSTAVIKPDPDP
ncbi:transposase [Rhodopila sp.]|uniref:transposase n=1 Tax=Rhodopila sp. TaxID=2480087 RepID=UPI003D0FD68D